MKLRAEQRFSHGLTFGASFVFGKAIDSNTSEPQNGGVEQDPNNLRAERGRSSFDIRERLIASVIYDLPFGRGKAFLNTGGLANAILGGWRIGSIISLQTGLPFTPTISGDVANTGRPQRPNRLGSGTLSNPTISHWFDVAAFAPAAIYTYGNSGRNILDQPGLRDWDFSAFKEFTVRERSRVEFRAEFFNFTNTPFFAGPATAINVPSTAGKIFSAGAPRDVQFGLKYIF